MAVVEKPTPAELIATLDVAIAIIQAEDALERHRRALPVSVP
jgi:hypothetical protein